MSDAEKNDGGLTRREFAKTVAAGVAALAAANSLSAMEAHGAQSAPPAASGNQEERDLCRELSAFIVKTKWEDLPPNVVHDTKMLFLDSVGDAIAGGTCVPGKMIIDLAQRFGGPPESSIIGGRGKVSPSSAVLANGQLINQLDFDSMPPGGHTPAYVIPPALALAESGGASGKALIVAMALGFEMAARVDSAVGGGMAFDADGNIKWAPRTGSAVTAFGAVAGAGKILNLDENKMANAIGTAGHLSQVLTWIRQTFAEHRSMTKYGVPGWQDTGSLMAAMLADMGYMGDTTLFNDPEQGFWKFAGYDGWHPGKVLDGIGTKWTFTRVRFKPRPCCSMFQDQLEMFYKIIEENKIAPGDIESVKILGHPTLDMPLFQNRELTNVVDVQFGPANAFSLVANGVAPGADWGNLDIVRSAKIQDLAKKITYGGAPHYGKHPIESVEVVAKGKTFKEEASSFGVVTGTKMTDAELIAKFQHNASGVLPPGKIEQAQKAFVDLENVTNTAEMMKAVTL